MQQLLIIDSPILIQELTSYEKYDSLPLESDLGPPLAAGLVLVGCVGPWSQVQQQPSRLEHVTTANFEERVLKCDKPVLVDFYADWCGPCKKLGPVLDDFADEHPEIRVVKVNVDENRDLVGRYGVNGFPSCW